MQLAVAKLRQAWPLLLIALFGLRRWWLRRFKKESQYLPGGHAANAPRNRGLRRHAGPCVTSHSAQGADCRGLAQAMPPLWAATEKGDLDTVMQLLQDGQITECTYKGWTPLHKAAEEGHCGIMKALLEKRARLDATNSKGRSALSFAAAPSMGRQASKEAVEFLLNASANPKHKDKRGETALARAERGGFLDSAAIIRSFQLEPRPAGFTLNT